jgi:hypothetical protein
MVTTMQKSVIEKIIIMSKQSKCTTRINLLPMKTSYEIEENYNTVENKL